MDTDNARFKRRLCEERLRIGKLRRIAIGTVAISLASLFAVTSLLA
jgi:hypothetical protein